MNKEKTNKVKLITKDGFTKSMIIKGFKPIIIVPCSDKQIAMEEDGNVLTKDPTFTEKRFLFNREKSSKQLLIYEEV